jgi:hypothetical protein
VRRDLADWWQWWENYNETFTQKPTLQAYDQTVSTFAQYRGVDQYDVVNTPNAVVQRPTGKSKRVYRQLRPGQSMPPAFSFSVSCFVPSTPVWMETGLVLIKDIQIGDKVLSQEPDTGELAFRLVLGKTLRPPADLARIRIEGEEIIATKGHPFWVANRGWQMAKHLPAGDQLHSVSGGLLVHLPYRSGLASAPRGHRREALVGWRP